MAIQRNQPAALRRRVTTYSLATGVVVALVVGVVTGIAVLGWLVLLLALAVSGFIYYNFTRVMRTRGYR